jgi:hypothetical protein
VDTATALEPVTLHLHGLTPPSLNTFTRAHWRKYVKAKAEWDRYVTDALHIAETPRGEWAGVLAEGRVTFPDKRARDQGNYRFMLEKALGDALVAYGAIPDDDWSRYEFGNLQARYERGVRLIEVMLWPR